MSRKLTEHQEKISQGYSSLQTGTNTTKQVSNHWLIIFDLMQNLPVPTLTHDSTFYLRQLWVYNFGIHNATSNSASMYMWNETITSKRADEICSCLQKYIETLPSEIQLTCYWTAHPFMIYYHSEATYTEEKTPKESCTY